VRFGTGRRQVKRNGGSICFLEFISGIYNPNIWSSEIIRKDAE
jgi:hypothetical protein